MRKAMRMVAVAVAVGAVAVVGCTSTSSQETPAAGSASATTGPASIPTPTPKSQQPQPSPRTLLLTAQGLGGVPVGVTLAEFAKALGRSPTPMSATDRSVFADHSCVIRQLDRLPGVGLMVIGKDPEGQVRRISVEAGSDLRTDKGIGLGSSLAAVRAVYGQGLDEPFDHFPVGGDAVLVRAGDLHQVFIGDDLDRVVELRLGYRPEALYSEGCV